MSTSATTQSARSVELFLALSDALTRLPRCCLNEKRWAGAALALLDVFSSLSCHYHQYFNVSTSTSATHHPPPRRHSLPISTSHISPKPAERRSAPLTQASGLRYRTPKPPRLPNKSLYALLHIGLFTTSHRC